jgi:hypothetical protein
MLALFTNVPNFSGVLSDHPMLDLVAVSPFLNGSEIRRVYFSAILRMHPVEKTLI